jgi:hypothetical protein
VRNSVRVGDPRLKDVHFLHTLKRRDETPTAADAANKQKDVALAQAQTFAQRIPKVAVVPDVQWNTIHLSHAQPDDAVDALAANYVDESHYDFVVRQEPTEIYKANGDLLLRYLPGAISPQLCKTAYQSLRNAATVTSNRGAAGGLVRPPKDRGDSRTIGTKSRVRFRPVKASTGELSHSSYSNHVRSGVIGYFDRQDRFPYCRMTAYTMDKYPQYAKALPFVRTVDSLFAQIVPDRYFVQRSLADATSADFHIEGTAFTTVTVNRNFRTAIHKDVGDLQEGFGVIAALEAGSYTGGFLVFPKHRVAVDLRTTGVLCADFHEWHGNTAILGAHYERVSCVFYYRAKMIACGSAEEEQIRADRVMINRQLRWTVEAPLTTLDES